MSTLKANSYQHVDRASPSITINSDGSVSIASTVTYEDVTSVDSVGMVTARSGLRATAGGLVVTAGVTTISGTSTFGDDVVFTGAAANVTWDKSTDDLIFNDNAKAIFGTSSDGLEIYHNGNNSIINDTGTGNLIIAGSVVHIKNGDSSESFAKFTNGGSAQLYHNDTLRLATTTSGITISDQLNVAGISTFAGGVGIADSIFHTGDDNTAIRFPAADTITAETGGSERLRIASTGEVLIGSASTVADTKLIVEGSGTTLLRVGNSDDGIAGLVLHNTGSSNWNIQNENANLKFKVAGNEKFSISSAGKVGIGSDAPSGTLSLLANNPNIRFDDSAGSSSNNGEITLDNTQLRIEVDEDDVVASSQIKFRVDGGDRMNINSDGQVAINASSGNAPTHWDSSTRLSVNGRINSVGSASTASMNTGNGTVVNIGALTNHNLQFIVNNSTKATINQDGNANFTGIVTATEFVPTVAQTGFKNIVINGGMNVDQINGGSAYTGTSAYIIDRWRVLASGTDENPTSNQHPLTSSDTGPWAKGFRTSLHITNGNQTSGAGSADFISIQQRIEGREMAQSGWEYTSASSYVTLSFWVKSSVAQNFYGYLRTMEGTDQRYAFETGSLTANTWKKVTKTVPGDSDLVFNNDNGQGFQINISPFWGDSATTSGVPLNAWSDYSNSTRVPDMTSTWYTTNNSTFEITGVQFEVGSQATPFEHTSYAEQLRRCQRYYQEIQGSSGTTLSYLRPIGHDSNTVEIVPDFVVPMRANPTVTVTGTIQCRACAENTTDTTITLSGSSFETPTTNITTGHMWWDASSGTPFTAGYSGRIKSGASGSSINFSAEL